MQAVKRVFRYLRGSVDAKIRIGGSQGEGKTQEIVAYFDASFADDPDDRCSTFGYVLFYSDSAVLWKSKKHKAVSLLTTDAEYVAATEATRDVCWIENIFSELRIKLRTPVRMLGDNANANNLANGTSVNNRTRHIALRERYVTSKATEGLIRVEKVGTNNQVADMLTKPLAREALLKHAVACGMIFNEHLCILCLEVFSSKHKLHGHVRLTHNANVEGIYCPCVEHQTLRRDVCLLLFQFQTHRRAICLLLFQFLLILQLLLPLYPPSRTSAYNEQSMASRNGARMRWRIEMETVPQSGGGYFICLGFLRSCF